MSASIDHPADHPTGHVDPTATWGLVTASQAGDMGAFGEVVVRYDHVVLGYVLRRTGDRGLAEDLTQETFLRALRGIGSVRYQGRDIGAWLFTIARNLVCDHRKSARSDSSPSPRRRCAGWPSCSPRG